MALYEDTGAVRPLLGEHSENSPQRRSTDAGIVLRDYQESAVAEIRERYRDRRHRSVLFVMATGAGKTVAFSYIVAASQKLGKRCLVLVHRRELVEQASRTFDGFGIEHGLIMSGRSGNRIAVQIAMVGTVVRRLDKIAPPDFIVVDEAHHALAATYRKIIDAFPTAKVLGVTATPQRTDGAGLGDVFEAMVVGPSMRSLIEREALAPYSLFGPPAKVDLSGVKTVRGDYDQKQLAREMDRAVVTGDAVEHYQRIVGNGLALAFCVGREHAEHVAEAFREAGITAERIDGSMTVGEREAILGRFESGETRVMTSADLVSEGFDVPAVEAAILLRPTQSVILYLQQVGRALRPSPGKAKAYIIDHVGNFRLHGFPDDDREWTLEGRKKGERRELGKIPVTTCQSCFAAYRPHLPECPHCGAKRESEGRTLEYVDGQLVEITPKIERMRAEKAWMEAEKAAGRAPVMWPMLNPDGGEVAASLVKASDGGNKGVRVRLYPGHIVLFRPYNSMPAKQLKVVGSAFGYKPFWAARTHFINTHGKPPDSTQIRRAQFEMAHAS